MNTSAESIAETLSAPTNRQFEAAVDSATIQIATVVFSLLESAVEPLDAIGTPLPNNLLTASDEFATFNYIWTPAIAECWLLLSGETETARRERAIARLFANAAAGGFSGAGSISPGQPCHVLWKNLLLPDVSGIRFKCNGADRFVAVSREHAGTAAYQLRREESGHWRSTDAHNVIQLPALDAGDIVLISSSQVDSIPSWDLGLPLVPTIADSDVRQVQNALDMLNEVNPLYHRWVTKVSRCIQIVDSPDRRLESGSAKWQWGNIAISRLDDSIESICSTCEMLIHENSHQYFHVVSSLGKLASDTDEYFSPFPKAMRQLEPILLGAHAFVNVLAFYRDLPSKHPDLEGWCRSQIGTIVANIDQVRPLLEDTKKLTPLGQALIGPLVSILETIPSTT